MMQHTAVYALAQAVTAALGFVAVVAYTRLLTPEEYGVYAVAIAAVRLAYSFGGGWLGSGITRLYAAYQDTDRSAFTGTVALQWCMTAGALTFIAALCVSLVDLGSGLDRVAWVAVACVAPVTAFEYALSVRRAQGDPGSFGRLAAARAAVGLGVGAALAWAGWGARGVLWGVFLGAAAPVVATVWREREHLRLGHSSRAIAERLMRYGGPLIIAAGCERLIATMDRFFLTGMVSAAEAGVYAAGYAVALYGVGFGIQAAGLATWPLIASAFETNDSGRLHELLERTVAFVVGIGVPSAVGLWCVASEVTNVFLGPEFRESAEALIPIIGVAILLMGIHTTYLAVAFRLPERMGRFAWAVGVGAVVNAGMNIVLIPKYGGFGAAWAAVAAYGAVVMVSASVGRPLVSLPVPVRAVMSVLAASAVMAGVLFFIDVPATFFGLIVKVLVGAAAYGATLLALNPLDMRGALRAGVRRDSASDE